MEKVICVMMVPLAELPGLVAIAPTYYVAEYAPMTIVDVLCGTGLVETVPMVNILN